MRDVSYLAERLRAANPVPDPSAPPSAAWSADLVLLEIERRSGVMQTDQVVRRDTGIDRDSDSPAFPAKPWWRGPAAAAAAFAVVLAIVGASMVVINQSGGDVAGRTPLEIAELYYERFEAGNYQGAMALFSPDATWLWADSTETHEGVVFSTDQYDVPMQVRSQADWDGDGAVTAADSRAGLIADLYAAGVELRANCTAAGEQVTCTQDPISAFITADSPLLEGEITFTIRDGLIVDERNLLGWVGLGPERLRQAEYEVWVREQHTDLADQLFIPSGQGGHLLMSPDTAATHRELIAEWSAGGA